MTLITITIVLKIFQRDTFVIAFLCRSKNVEYLIQQAEFM